MSGENEKRIQPEDTQFRLVRAMLIDCYQMAWSKHPGTSLILAALETMLPEGVSASDYSALRRIQEADMAAQPNATPPGTEVVPEGTDELEAIVLELESTLGAIASATRDDAWIRGRASLAKGVLHHVMPSLRAILTRHRATQKETPNAQG